MRLSGFLLLITWGLTNVAIGQQRVAFVTSVSGQGDLGAWPDAGAATGVAAGDAICQARAAAAGLANSGNFVALLSDSNDDAYCRLHGFGGQKTDDCDQVSLPINAGPWVNTRGENFAEKIPEMLTPNLQVYRSLEYNEFGAAVNDRYFTGSFGGGNANPGDQLCDDWTDTPAAFARAGSSMASASGVFSVGSSACNSNARLACFETIAGDPLIPEIATGSLAFVTSARDNGDLSSWALAGGAVGVDAADAICQASALDAGLPQPESFIAWISDASIDAKDRFDYLGPWYREDGVVVIDSLAEQIDTGQLKAPINLTEDFVYLGNWGVWTGTDGFGSAEAEHCQNWMTDSDSEQGRRGSAHFTDVFSNFFIGDCDGTASRLYCLHNVDIDLIFADDFEP